MKSLVKNSADEAQVKKGARLEKFALDEASEDWRFVMSTQRGRRFVYRLIGKTGLLAKVFGSDPHANSYHAGRKELGIDLMVEIDQACPEQYFLMMREAKEEEEDNE